MNKKHKYCPNTLLSNDRFSIGFFKTLEDVDKFPLKLFWELDKRFKSYETQGTKVFILCDWAKSIQDSTKFMLILLKNNGEISCYDLNNIEVK